MRLLSLTVENFGLYRGVHHFDLTSAYDTKSPKNLVLFQGHNGAGKSTIFQAVPLALHGFLALGVRLSRQQYETYLLRMCHRKKDIVCSEAAIGLSFEYVQSGKPLRIHVERRWTHTGKKVFETLHLTQNGQPLTINPEDFQTWLNELIPPGISSLCFFDAERLEDFSSPEQHNKRLSEAIKRLLGLDLVDRLQADLEQFTLHQGGAAKTDRLRTELIKAQKEVEVLEVQVENLEEVSKGIEKELATTESALAFENERLIAAGGGFAERKTQFQARLKEIDRELADLHHQIQEFCAGLGPFSIAPKLLIAVRESLKRELNVQRLLAAGAVWSSQIETLKQAFQGEDVRQTLEGIPQQQQETIINLFVQLLEKNTLSTVKPNEPLVHNLSEPDNNQLQVWISQALTFAPQQSQTFKTQLAKLNTEKRSLKNNLDRAPDEYTLASTHDEIAKLETKRSELKRRYAGFRDDMAVTRRKFEERTRTCQKLSEQFLASQLNEHRIKIAEQSKLVLQTYKDTLAQRRIAALEKALCERFNQLCRKDALVSSISIDPETFNVQLQNSNGTVMGLEELSAGERQLYALALFAALRQVSKHDLPLLIDTPLARLDETHRSRVIRDYLPVVSKQVILFVTDAEIDQNTLTLLDQSAARRFQLCFNPQTEETQVIESVEESHPLAIYVT